MRVVVIGAGIGGLSAAIALAARGVDVTLLEKEAHAGGKMRAPLVAGRAIDSGPTVLTMKWVFDRLFACAGSSFDACVPLSRADVLARHFWRDGSSLDLFDDVDRTADAIAAFSTAAEADAYRAFTRQSARIYDTLERPYMDAECPGPMDLVARIGPGRIGDLLSLRPFSTLWSALGAFFSDTRLRQLFARYATYCGSSPFAAPATLMLIAYAERKGVWTINGGMIRLAAVMAQTARDLGCDLRLDLGARKIAAGRNGVTGVVTERDEWIDADAIVYNGDISALGLLGLHHEMTGIKSVAPANRSLSAVTFAMVGNVRNFPLAHHNVFFGDDYRDEFAAIFERASTTERPTVYLCAQDRPADGGGHRKPEERLFCLINAPANGDTVAMNDREIARCLENTIAQMKSCGLDMKPDPGSVQTTTPHDFARLFPATGGALYGRAQHGWTASFARPGARTKIAGLYLAGGSVHPGPGVPMAAISGQLAAAALTADLVSTGKFHPAAMRGGTSTGSVPAAAVPSPSSPS